MRSLKTTLCAAVLLGLAACGTESPVELGDLVPDEVVSTAEVILEAPDFLEWDSVRTGFVLPRDVRYLVAAEKYDGALDARALLRFSALPRTLSYTDTTGTLVVDSIPDLVSGQIAFTMDTVRTVGDGPIEVAVYTAAESWDWGSAGWTARVDTGSVRHEWAEPGGTRGELLGTGSLEAGDSVLTVPIAAEVLELLQDSTTQSRGVIVQPLTPGSRIEFSAALLRVESRPRALPDTLIADSVGIAARTFLLNSAPDPEGALLVGGLPSWRSYLRLREGLGELELPCPGSSEGCTVRLGDVVLNHASIQLQPIPASPGFTAIDTGYVGTRAILAVDGIPISRAPMSNIFGGIAPVPPPSDPAGAQRIDLSITELMISLAGDSAVAENTPRTIALLANPDGGRVGVAAFGSGASGSTAPRLRLIYSVMNEVPAQ